MRIKTLALAGFLAALACAGGASRSAVREAAFTKCFEPSSQVSTDASPGVNPLSHDALAATGDPVRSSTAARTRRGRCGQVSRRAVCP